MSLSKTLYPLLSTGSTYEDMAEENVDWYIKNEIKPTKAYTLPIQVNNVYTIMCEKGHEIWQKHSAFKNTNSLLVV